jgi:hypothetical protein
MNDESENMWQEPVAARFEGLFRHTPGETIGVLTEIRAGHCRTLALSMHTQLLDTRECRYVHFF